MEKIKTREFKLFWGPQLIMGLASLVTGLFAFIPLLNIIVALLAGLVSLACAVFVIVYRVYFFYQLSLDINTVCEGDGLESPSFLYVAVLDSLTFGIYGLFWTYKVAQRLQANAPRYGFKMVVGGKEMVVLQALTMSWFSTFEFIRNMNKFAKVYNQNAGVPDMVGGAQ